MISQLISTDEVKAFEKYLEQQGFDFEQNWRDGVRINEEALAQLLSAWEESRTKFYKKALAEQNQLMFLGFLEEAGVDNWEGYSEAHKLLRDYKKEQEEPHGFERLEQLRKEN